MVAVFFFSTFSTFFFYETTSDHIRFPNCTAAAARRVKSSVSLEGWGEKRLCLRVTKLRTLSAYILQSPPFSSIPLLYSSPRLLLLLLLWERVFGQQQVKKLTSVFFFLFIFIIIDKEYVFVVAATGKRLTNSKKNFTLQSGDSAICSLRCFHSYSPALLFNFGFVFFFSNKL